MTPAQQLFAAHGHEIFRYDFSTGLFTYAADAPLRAFASEKTRKTWLAKCAGRPADVANNRGYYSLRFRHLRVSSHRFAWFLAYGEWPGAIDHINGDKRDNRLVNLRDVDQTTNRMNQRRRSDNRSGVTGVFFNKARGMWVAEICVSGRRRHLGRFASRDEAVRVRLATQEVMGFSPHHGRAD